MHPLMNRFHADEQRRLMELLGVDESSAPVVSRRVFLQSAGATGLAIGFGWLSPTGARRGAARRRGRRHRPARAERVHPRRHRQSRHRDLQASRDGPGQHDRARVARRRRARCRLGAGAHRVRALRCESATRTWRSDDAGHRWLVRHRQFVPAVPQRRRHRAGDARRRRRRSMACAGRRDPDLEEHAHARLGPARNVRRDGDGRKPPDAARESAAEERGAIHVHRQGPLDAASRFAVEVQRHARSIPSTSSCRACSPR